MKAIKYKADGSKSGEVSLAESVFIKEFNRNAIYNIVRAEQVNRRQGTHKTKERAEVRGGGKKPWRQKGTGNARQGTIRAPQWKGGGTVFGPRPRNYEIRLSGKMRHAGIRSILGKKAVANSVAVIEDLQFDSPSTKNAYGIFKKMKMVPHGTVALVVSGENDGLQKSVRNIPFIRYINAGRLTTPELYFSDHVLFTQSALDQVVKHYSASKGDS